MDMNLQKYLSFVKTVEYSSLPERQRSCTIPSPGSAG